MKQRAFLFLLVALASLSATTGNAQGWQEITPPGMTMIPSIRTFDLGPDAFAVYVWGDGLGYTAGPGFAWDSMQTRAGLCPNPYGYYARLVDIARSSHNPNTVVSFYADAGGCSIECYLFLCRDTLGRVTPSLPVFSLDDFLCQSFSTKAAFSPVARDLLFFVFFDSLYRSSNGGRTFTSISSPYAQPYNPLLDYLALSPHNPDIIFMAGYGQDPWVYLFYRSSDGGLSWSEVIAGWRGQMIFDPQDSLAMYAAGDSGIFRSMDEGLTWQRSASQCFSSIAADPGEPGVLFAGSCTGEVWKSTDAGVSWLLYNNTFSTSAVKHIFPLPDTDTLVVATLWGVFKVFAPFTLDVAESGIGPQGFVLHQCYPNPFNPTTTFLFDIGHSTFVILKVYDILGREVATLINERKEPGRHHVEFNAAGLPGGVYIYRMQAGGYAESRKMMLTK